MWGALLGSGSSSPKFSSYPSTDKIPVIAFHGKKTELFPILYAEAVLVQEQEPLYHNAVYLS